LRDLPSANPDDHAILNLDLIAWDTTIIYLLQPRALAYTWAEMNPFFSIDTGRSITLTTI
jgi:hypothetical protein